MLMHLGCHSKALELLQAAVAVHRQLVMPETHPIIAVLLAHISSCQSMLGRDDEAAVSNAALLSTMRRSQVNCPNPGCPRRLREDGAPLDVCVKCRRTFYCGKACQTADWKREGGHKAECKTLIAEGKAAAAAAGKSAAL